MLARAGGASWTRSSVRRRSRPGRWWAMRSPLCAAFAAAAVRRLGLLAVRRGRWRRRPAAAGCAAAAPAGVDQHELTLVEPPADRRASRFVPHITNREADSVASQTTTRNRRVDRARAGRAVPVLADPGGGRPGAVDRATGPAGPRALAAGEHAGPVGDAGAGVAGPPSTGGSGTGGAGGFDALAPAPRPVAPRTPAEVLDLAVALKTGGAGAHRRPGRRRSCGRRRDGRRANGPCNATSPGSG